MIIYDDNDELIPMPMKWEICDGCKGEGVGYLGNRGFVLTQEDLHDVDMLEDMMTGHYDQSCVQCGGSGKVKFVNEDALSNEHKIYLYQEYEYQRAEAQERAMGY